MNKDWFEELKLKADAFLKEASDEEIKKALKEANYELHTGQDPSDLNIHAYSETSKDRGDDVFNIGKGKKIAKFFAWRLAYESRACPKDRILFTREQSPELKAHLGLCKICREKIEAPGNLDAWKELAEQMRAILPKPAGDIKPSAGQVWSLKRKLDGWGANNRYYKAPMVLILEALKGEFEDFGVAQVYSDRELMDAGDVWLSEELGFAESWNIYSISRNDLEFCWGEVSHEVGQKVLGGAEELLPISDEDGIIALFRNLETDLGSHCILHSAARQRTIILVPVWVKKQWLKWESPVWEPQWAGVRATAADIPEQTQAFSTESGEIKLFIYWCPKYRDQLPYVRIKWEKSFLSSDELWVRFVNPETGGLRSELPLGTFQEGEIFFTSEELGFDPSTEKWALAIAMIEPKPITVEILEGVKIWMEKAKERVLTLTDLGLQKIADYFELQSQPPLAWATTRGAPKIEKELSEEETKQLGDLQEALPFLPIDFRSLKGDVVKIDFKWLTDKTSKPPLVSAALRGKSISKENIHWEVWRSEIPILVIKNCPVTPKEQKDAKTLLRVSYKDNQIQIDIIPE